MNDARGCFDHIEYIAAIVVQMNFGVVYTVATTLFLILQKTRHQIKTKYGVSELVYGDRTVPVARIG